MADYKELKVIVTRKIPQTVESRMAELFDCEFNEDDTPLSKEQLIDAIGRADVLIPTLTDDLSAEVIGHAGKKMRLIANFGAGVDHIDLEAAQKKGLIVTNTPSVLTEDTADMTLALILAVPRRLHEGERLARSGNWEGWAPTQLLGSRIAGKRLGILGMGRIGQAVARRAAAFGLSIHYHNRKRLHTSMEEDLKATYHDTPESLLKSSDILSIHCPHTKDTHHLLSATRLNLLSNTSYIINTSRGAVIDEKALVIALKEKRIAGAGLDVYENEPHIDPELLTLDNVVLIPHMCSATEEARTEMGEKVLINIMCYLDQHRPPPDRVLVA
jgi:glyoxylate reductase